MRGELAIFGLAVQFLTRLPVPLGESYSPERAAASVRYYPLVGILIGSLCAAVYWTADWVWPSLPSAMLAVVAGLLVTGALHEDGLADTFDGIGGARTRDQAIAIMKDSRLGTYGVLALILVLALKISALSQLDDRIACIALVTSHGLSRLACVLVIATGRYVGSTPGPAAHKVSMPSLLVACGTGIAIIAGFAGSLPLASVLAALFGLAIGHACVVALVRRTLGGHTGDTLGAVQQAGEVGVYLGLAAWT
jgi:adenosylcobinamide-GDP ribazoletransferase